MPEYSADRFYTDATDKHGVSAKMQITIPPSLHGEISELIASRNVPNYRTMADFGRDAVFHRLKYLEQHYELTPALEQLILRMQTVNESIAALRRDDDFQTLIENRKLSLSRANLAEKQDIRSRIRRDLETLDMPSFARGALEDLL